VKRLLSLCILPLYLFGNEVAFIKSMQGEVIIKRANNTVALKLKDKLYPKDMIIINDNSSATVTFLDGSVVSLGENSILSINNYVFIPSKNHYLFDVFLSKGKAMFESGKVGKMAPASVKFRIPQARIGIRGTKFLVEVQN